MEAVYLNGTRFLIHNSRTINTLIRFLKFETFSSFASFSSDFPLMSLPEVFHRCGVIESDGGDGRLVCLDSHRACRLLESEIRRQVNALPYTAPTFFSNAFLSYQDCRSQRPKEGSDGLSSERVKLFPFLRVATQ